MRIVQMSDLDVGDAAFRPELLSAAIEETNELAPGLVVIAGDLTIGLSQRVRGVQAVLDGLESGQVVATMGTMPAMSGYRHFEDLFGRVTP